MKPHFFTFLKTRKMASWIAMIIMQEIGHFIRYLCIRYTNSNNTYASNEESGHR